MQKKTLSEFSVMRSFAILTILFHHLPAYTFNYYDLRFFGIGYDLSYINDLNRYFGLSIFVYISGFLLTYVHNDLTGWQDIRGFISKRIVRIFPLYILALFIFINIVESTNAKGLIIHLLGLQIFLSPALCDPILTLWYVGLIVLFYLLFIVIKKYGTTPQRTMLILLAIPVAAMALRFSFNIIEKRFFIYYAVFILGIYGSKLATTRELRLRTTVLAVCLFLLAAYLYVSYIYPQIKDEATRPSLFSMIGLEALVLVNVIMLCFAWTIHQICLKINFLPKYFDLISYSSYGMYLFHRPLWWGMQQIYNPADEMLRALYLSAAGIPVLIFFSFLIQKFYDRVSISVLKK